MTDLNDCNLQTCLLGVGYEICLHSLIAILQNTKHKKEKQGGKRENVVNVSCLGCLWSFV